MTPISLPSSLSEKVDYQIYQARLLTGIAEDNRLALKRLLSMMADFYDNQINAVPNRTDEHGKKHIPNIGHVNPGL